MKKYRKYIIQMSVYIAAIIIAITAAIVIPKEIFFIIHLPAQKIKCFMKNKKLS